MPLVIDPQLCKNYNSAKFKWWGVRTWAIEPKLDGLRCIIELKHNVAMAYSRNGKPLYNTGTILTELEGISLKTDTPNIIWDGEVYTKDWNLSMSIVKRSTQTHPDQDKLRYHVWDCLTPREWKAGKSLVFNHDRRLRLLVLNEGNYVEIVPSKSVNSEEEMLNAYATYLGQGYEGAILKDPQGIYELGRRSPFWLKIKPWHDADLTCTGSYPGEGKHVGRIGGLILEGDVLWNEQVVRVRTEVGTGFSDEERATFQRMSDMGTLDGKIVEIKFQDVTRDGSCRFPVYHRLREDKE